MTTNVQEAHAIEGKVIYVLALVIIVQTLYPFTASDSLIPLFIYQFLYGMLMFAGVIVARQSPIYFRLLIIFGIVWLISGAVFAFYQDVVWIETIAYAVIFCFQALVIRVLLEYIFITNTVNRDVLYAAITVYVLLGALFVPIYGMVEDFTFLQTGQGAFSDSLADPTMPLPWQTFIYYSYATLTTLGYGDILPVTMWSRSIASVQAVVGVLYTTIIMARLVS
ncbi:MAG: potassium channel family protein, partial [Chloroflexota bacterium]